MDIVLRRRQSDRNHDFRRRAMSTDLRNSLYLWAGSIAFFGLFWANSHFAFFHLSKTWSDTLITAVGLVSLGRLIWAAWRRRASRTNNPDQS
jgi:hypothetical protein